MKQPVFGKETRVAPGAVVLGEVDCGEGVSVKIDGEPISGVTTENAADIFRQYVLKG